MLVAFIFMGQRLSTMQSLGVFMIISGVTLASFAIVNYRLTIGDAILIMPIASALSILTITLAIIFLKDNVTKLQGLGMIATIAGRIATAFYNFS
jgi:uncharacterized membrane protein